MRQIMMAQAVTVGAEAAEVTTTINLRRHLVRSSPVEVVVAALPQVAGVETIKAKVTTKAVVTTKSDYNPWQQHQLEYSTSIFMHTDINLI